MTKKSKETFDYSMTQWGIAKIKNYRSNFQGYELELLIKGLGEDTKKKLRVLDLGCGGGNVDGFLKTKFPNWDINGIDVSVKALEMAGKNFPGVKFINQSVDKLEFNPKTFDVILSLDTMEHFENPEKVAKSVLNLLKDNGLFFLSIPLEKQFPTFYYLMNKLGLDKKKRGSVGHINVYNNKEVSDLFKKAGFTEEHRYFGGQPIYTMLDFACYWILRADKRQKPSFESSLIIMEPGLKRTVLLSMKKLASNLIYFENKIFSWLPGGRGHYFFRKSDFFSVNQPLTLFEDWQIKNGLGKFLRPKDLVIKKHLDNLGLKNAKQILDYGCADGIWLERILKGTKLSGAGVDISPDLINMANGRKNKRGVYYNSSESWPIKDKSVDFCFSFDVIEHLRNRPIEINKLSKSIKKGGKVLIFTLNPNDKFTFAWLLGIFGSDWLYRHFDHLKSRFVSPQKLTEELKDKGFSEIGYELYPGPLNLSIDVFCYGYLKIMERIMGKKTKWILDFNDCFVRFIYPINLFLDKIFTSHGYSNGYFLWAKK
jgi:2-polyprenyl-3-methyl-5-hydroxy-6-metoxy-1,4-benzoquinol methylase